MEKDGHLEELIQLRIEKSTKELLEENIKLKEENTKFKRGSIVLQNFTEREFCKEYGVDYDPYTNSRLTGENRLSIRLISVKLIERYKDYQRNHKKTEELTERLRKIQLDSDERLGKIIAREKELSTKARNYFKTHSKFWFSMNDFVEYMENK